MPMWWAKAHIGGELSIDFARNLKVHPRRCPVCTDPGKSTAFEANKAGAPWNQDDFPWLHWWEPRGSNAGW